MPSQERIQRERPCSECDRVGYTDEWVCPECHRGSCCVWRCEDRHPAEQPLCTECCHLDEDRHPPEIIQEYDSRAYPCCRPNPYQKGALYLGVELEVECGEDDSREAIARKIYQQHKQDILLKEDGSLTNGFELVTGAFSLDEHKKLWPILSSNAIRAGARSWWHRSTGLHVHLSRSFFSPLEIGKMLVFLNSPVTRPHIIALAGRTSPDFAAIEKKQLKDAYKFRYERAWDGRRMSTRRPTIQANGGHRYEILNLQNSATVEIRIFKGTLASTHIRSE